MSAEARWRKRAERLHRDGGEGWAVGGFPVPSRADPAVRAWAITESREAMRKWDKGHPEPTP